MVLSRTILILEDDLLSLSKILDRLVVLEQDQPFDFSIIVLTNHIQVKNMVNNNPDIAPDIILLDRDCKLGGSFHVLDIERFGADKVIFYIICTQIQRRSTLTRRKTHHREGFEQQGSICRENSG